MGVNRLQQGIGETAAGREMLVGINETGRDIPVRAIDHSGPVRVRADFIRAAYLGNDPVLDANGARLRRLGALHQLADDDRYPGITGQYPARPRLTDSGRNSPGGVSPHLRRPATCKRNGRSNQN